jgi:uncharacterized integral membrane protein
MVKILNILHWILNIALFVLAIVLVLDNIQTVEFNVFGIYSFKLPLIAMAAIFLSLGIVIGFFISFFQKVGLKSEIGKLTKEIELLRKSSNHDSAQ